MKSEEEMCPDANDIKEIYKAKSYRVFFFYLRGRSVCFLFLTDASRGNFLC